MTLVAQQMIVEINGEKSRQLSWEEIASIVSEMERMFGVLDDTTGALQSYLDRYCQRKGKSPLVIASILV